MADELKLEHKTLDEAINFHSTMFEYQLNMGHLSGKHGASTSEYKFFTEAAVHATILAELRVHKYEKTKKWEAERGHQPR